MFSSKKVFQWISLGLFIKLLIVIILYYNHGLYSDESKYPFLLVGDHFAYMQTTTNIINHGVYALYGSVETGLEKYTGRMPGYEFVLVLFKLFLPNDYNLYAVIILQQT